jgi:hypothetical protein
VIARFTVGPFEFFVLRTRTRFPFRYGIASLTDVPHLFVRTRVAVAGRSAWGLTAEGLPPKWFTKDPATTFEQDLGEMLEVIAQASAVAEQVGRSPLTFFDFWQELDRQQRAWAETRPFPPLLTNLGVSLVERAVLDGLGRLLGEPLHRLVATNALGLRLGEVYPELGAGKPSDFLAPAPLASCYVRHTIGLSDALSPGDLSEEERVLDGLPQDLEACIRAYGLRYFKVKLRGTLDLDVPRLVDLVGLLERETRGDYWLTLDGNESFGDCYRFREFWERLRAEARLRPLWSHVVAVEQPVHRAHALDVMAGRALAGWSERPPLIIDESDGAVGDLVAALECGYVGTSHKNCKGIVKGIANAAVLEKRRREGQRVLLTGEDLCTLGPFALVQDLAMMALLAITHVERNGHHYYRGLSAFPFDWQQSMIAAHPDLYRRHPDGFAMLRIDDGQLRLDTANAAPFGVRPELDPSVFEPVTLGAGFSAGFSP